MSKQNTDIKSLAHTKWKKQISCSAVCSNLNKSGPWIYQNAKIMFHMTFPYDEVYDSDYYSICTENRKKVFFNEKKEAIREIIRTLCQWKGVEIIEGEICLAISICF